MACPTGALLDRDAEIMRRRMETNQACSKCCPALRSGASLPQRSNEPVKRGRASKHASVTGLGKTSRQPRVHPLCLDGGLFEGIYTVHEMFTKQPYQHRTSCSSLTTTSKFISVPRSDFLVKLVGFLSRYPFLRSPQMLLELYMCCKYSSVIGLDHAEEVSSPSGRTDELKMGGSMRRLGSISISETTGTSACCTIVDADACRWRWLAAACALFDRGGKDFGTDGVERTRIDKRDVCLVRLFLHLCLVQPGHVFVEEERLQIPTV
ncbi:hypothetical protein AB1N83_004033 [Pleurotus pulmonarius]